jgi:hypothetical protein
MTTAQTIFTESELLDSHRIAAPLIAGGVRCHGGFDDDGNYVSPRTLNRWPAIHAWQEQRAEQFGTPLLDIPLETWPEQYPSVAQARYLLEAGVREPIVSTLTRIGTVEGFGSMIRHSVIPDIGPLFLEDVAGTALDHLGRGLYEAHARDEAGYGDEGGHKQMWFAARDIAFDHPVTEDETELMLFRMGIAGPPGSAPLDLAALRAAAEAARLWPDEMDFDLEMLVERMARLLLIEISAFHTFAWAEDLLSDSELTAGDGQAAKLVSYVRADESPHVEYLKTVLSEIRDRTLLGEGSVRFDGADLVGRTWDRAVADSLGARRKSTLDVTRAEVEHAVAGRRGGDEVLEHFDELGTVRPGPHGEWVDASGREVFSTR